MTGSSDLRPRVLIVEDDTTLAGNLYSYLENKGFMPDAAYEGRGALRILAEQPFDVVVLDIGLPGQDGYRVLQSLRQDLQRSVPVLILTARDQLEDKLAGFSHGADDYLTKPFALAEVEARLRALVNRSQGAVTAAPREFHGLSFDPRTRVVSVNGLPVYLARKSTQIVEMLMRDPGCAVLRTDLESALWGDETPASDALRSQIHLLRRALADAGFDGIETLHGTGWRLVVPSRPA
ncbi:putative two-component system response regulator [plant metagenome]|uniref:Putative two-component system response regulator n=1 Tax=plant metagenome TaxID=1297885 RepID=A0A484USS5_9ZZZZ